ncbi:MAG: ABC transporter ATP-binding protein [Ignisphaera sp.]|uniref:ABC transporter ATP-binding protein n=1 Tax=Ignisphaera aggregans TaxID=334771 RepID=A0A7C4JL43_9CREN
MAVLEVQGLKAYYMLRRGSIKAVDGVDLVVEDKSIVGVVGESGCGKSTLARAIALDITPPLKLVEGRIVIDGIEITRMPLDQARKKIAGVRVALVPQAAMNAIVPTVKIKDYIADIITEKNRDLTRKEAIDLAVKRFEELNLPIESLERYPFELSGGMRQRVLIALTTLLNPALLIADEPTSALDVSTQKIVLITIYNVFVKGLVKSILFISHDIATVRQISDRIIVMYAGKIVEIGSTEDVLHNPLHPYSKALMYSILTPELEVRGRIEKVESLMLIGEPPSLINPPPGCRFHPRCPYAMDICRREEPTLIELEKRRFVACWIYLNK